MFKSFKQKLLVLVVLLILALPVAVSAASGDAAFTVFNVDRTAVNAGQPVTFNVSTIGASYVFANAGGAFVPAVPVSQSGNQRSWTITVTPMTSQAVRVYANTTNAVTGAANISIPITVNAAVATPAPVQPQVVGAHRIYEVTEVETQAANTVRLRIVTDAATGYVWMSEQGTYRRAERVSETSTQRTWEITYRPRQYVAHTVEITANHAFILDNRRATLTHDVRLIEPFVPPVTPGINNVSARPTTIDEGDRTEITVRTNLDVQYVWAEVNNQRVNARRGNATATSRVWTIDARPNTTQTIRVYANTTNTETGAITNTVRVTVRDRRDEPEITSVRPSTLRVDDWMTIEVRTNSVVTEVWVEYDGGIARANRVRAGSNDWTVEIRPRETGRVDVFAGTSRNQRDAYRRRIDVRY